jgi:hypothetical protein
MEKVACDVCDRFVHPRFMRKETYTRESGGEVTRDVCVLCEHHLPYAQYSSDAVYGKGWMAARRARQRAIQRLWDELAAVDADYMAGVLSSPFQP